MWHNHSCLTTHLQFFDFVSVDTTKEIDLFEKRLHLVLIVNPIERFLIEILPIYMVSCTARDDEVLIGLSHRVSTLQFRQKTLVL